MNEKHASTNTSAARRIAATLGVLAGRGGLTHGVGLLINLAILAAVLLRWPAFGF